MSKICLKSIFIFPLVFFSFLFLSTPAYAAKITDSITLNGLSSVTVEPSELITASVTVTISSPDDWQSTTWNTEGDNNCVNHTGYTSSGTYVENFSVTAPSSPGTYDISFITYGNSTCGSAASDPYILTDGITVSTPTPTPTATPTSTPTPTATPGTTTTSTTIYYPSVILNTYFPDPTKETSLTFSGKANIEQGTIDSVEYSLDNGSNWIAATASDGTFEETSEEYTFTTTFSEGTHVVKVRAKNENDIKTQSSSYASDTVTVITTPPKVILDKIDVDQTKIATPKITGSVSSALTSISKVEVSFNSGETWLETKLKGNIFTITSEKLEDGNYEIKARATDSVGNISESESQTLIIDTIPPIIGGNMISIGSQVLTPNENGIIRTVVGAEIKLVASMKGGATEAKIISGKKEFALELIPGTNLWSTKLIYNYPGQYLLTIIAIDGAGNKTEHELNNIIIEEAGKIHEKDNYKTISKAEVKVYFLDTSRQSWVLWDATSYDQINPYKTNEDGKYSFLVPTGKYYIEVNAVGFKTVRSQILDLPNNSILNFDFPLINKPKIKINLPFFGEITLSIPSFEPPKTIHINSKPQTPLNLESKLDLGSIAPTIVLPTTNNKQLNTATLKEKYLLSFVSPWSTHSLEQISILNEAQKELKNQTILVVFLQESEGATQTFMRRGGYTFTALFDKNGESTNDFPITTLPQHFFVDSKKNLQEIYSGVLTKEELLKKINSLE